MSKIDVMRLWPLLLLALLVSLSGCATKSSVSTIEQCPRIPALPPSLAKPVPPELRSMNAAESIKRWSESLRASEAR